MPIESVWSIGPDPTPSSATSPLTYASPIEVRPVDAELRMDIFPLQLLKVLQSVWERTTASSGPIRLARPAASTASPAAPILTGHGHVNPVIATATPEEFTLDFRFVRVMSQVWRWRSVLFRKVVVAPPGLIPALIRRLDEALKDAKLGGELRPALSPPAT